MAEPATALATVEIKDGLVQLTNIDGAYRYAKYVIASKLAPKSFETAEAVMVAFQHGAELGLTPLQSLQHIGVINGRPALYGKGVAAVVMKSGLVEIFEESFEGKPYEDDFTAICTVKRKGLATVRTERYSVADAKKAGLWGKETWIKYPKEMMGHKCRARAFILFADVLAGLPVLEDIADVPAERTPLLPTKDGPPSRPPAAPDPLLAAVGLNPEASQIANAVDASYREAADEMVKDAPEPPDDPVIAASSKAMTAYADTIAQVQSKKELNQLLVAVNKDLSEGKLTQAQYEDLSSLITTRNKSVK